MNVYYEKSTIKLFTFQDNKILIIISSINCLYFNFFVFLKFIHKLWVYGLSSTYHLIKATTSKKKKKKKILLRPILVCILKKWELKINNENFKILIK